MKRKSVITILLSVILLICIGVGFCVLFPKQEKQTVNMEAEKGETELLFSFESYEDITGTSIWFNSLFGQTAINTDKNFITEGQGSWLVMPEGDYGLKDGFPKFRMRLVNTTFKKSDFNEYDKIMMDVYNASAEEVAIEWSFTTSNNSGIASETEKNVYTLQPGAWTTCEYDLRDEAYGSYFQLSMVERMNVTFLCKKDSREATVPTLYFDNVRGHFAEVERQVSDMEYDFKEGITFEKSTDFYLFTSTISETMQMDFERVAYADTELGTVDESQGDYALKGVATGATWPAITVHYGEMVPKDMILSFRMYVEADEKLVKDRTYQMEAAKGIDDKVYHGFIERKKNEFNQWVDVEIVLNHSHTSTWIWANFDNGYGASFLGPDTPVNIYFDNFKLTEKEEDVIVDKDGNVTLLNPYNVKDVSYKVEKSVKKGQFISFDIDFNMSESVAIWVLGDDEWQDEWYAEGVNAWGGKKRIQVEAASDTTHFFIYVQYREEHKQYKEYKCFIENIKISNEYVFEDLTLKNPANEDVIGYTFSRSVQKGQHISFEIDVTPKQAISVWVLGDDMWEEEYFAQSFTTWIGKQTIQANVTENTNNFTVYIKFLDESGDYKDNVVTIKNMQVKDGVVNENSDIIVKANGDVTLLNSYNAKELSYRVDKPVKKGQIISFNIDFNMSDSVGVWVLGDDEWQEEWYGEGFRVWPGSKHIQVEAKSDIQYFYIHIQYRGENEDYSKNKCTIKNIKILNEYALNDITLNNPAGDEVVGYTFSRSIKKGYTVSFDIDVTPKQPMTIWVLGDNMWEDEYYAQAFQTWSGKKQISANITEDTENFTVYVKFTDSSKDFSKNIVKITNLNVAKTKEEESNSDTVVDKDGTVTLKNSAGNSQVLYTFEKPLKGGQIVEFDIDVTPAQYIAVWLLGDGMWKDEYYAMPFETWTGKQTIRVKIPEDSVNFTINVEYRDANADFTKNVITISNLVIKEADVTVDGDGTIHIKNSEGAKRVSYTFATPIKAGETVCFDLQVTPSQKIALWVLDDVAREYVGEEFAAWDGKKMFKAQIEQPTDYFTVLVEYRGDSERKDNVLSISNMQIKEPDIAVGEDGSVTIRNSAGKRSVSHRFNQELKAGQTVSFDLEINPSQPVAVWLVGGYTEYIADVFTWEGKKTFTVPITESVTSFIIQVRYDGTQPYDKNVTTISNIQIVESEMDEDDGTVIIRNDEGKRIVKHTFQQELKAGQTISFDLEISQSQPVAVWLVGGYTEYIADVFTWEGKKTFTVPITESVTSFIIQVRYDGAAPYDECVATISNIQIN